MTNGILEKINFTTPVMNVMYMACANPVTTYDGANKEYSITLSGSEKECSEFLSLLKEHAPNSVSTKNVGKGEFKVKVARKVRSADTRQPTFKSATGIRLDAYDGNDNSNMIPWFNSKEDKATAVVAGTIIKTKMGASLYLNGVQLISADITEKQQTNSVESQLDAAFAKYTSGDL
jgi:hypothetical protein